MKDATANEADCFYPYRIGSKRKSKKERGEKNVLFHLQSCTYLYSSHICLIKLS